MFKKIVAFYLWLEVAPKVYMKLCVTCNCSGL